MNIESWVRLPWKIKDVVRSMRRDLADTRRQMAELSRMISALELRQEERTEELRRTTEELRRSDGRAWARTARDAPGRDPGAGTSDWKPRLAFRRGPRPRGSSEASSPHLLSREAGVSVLITCWNHAGVLGRAIASAIATLDALPVPGEVLILDDASRDGSREVAQELARGGCRESASSRATRIWDCRVLATCC